MSKQNYDSKFCGNLPISFINQVQSYGFLVVCDLSLTVMQISDNVSAFTEMEYDFFIDKNLEQLIEKKTFDSIQHKFLLNEQVRFSLTLNLLSEISSNSFIVVINKKDDYLLLEFEPSDDGFVTGFRDIYQQIRDAAGHMQQCTDLISSLNVAANELKAFSGFDKVMIYKFDEEWNGHVLAEAMEPEMESYLGITFPASDIPKQARELYLKNPYRLIPDREYKASKMYPIINPLSNGFVDMGTCNLRGVAKVHIEYLYNMNVKASMSTRILKDNNLWGLIACHHQEKKFLNFDACSVFELFSEIISTRLSVVETQLNLEKTNEMQTLMNSIIKSIYSETMLINAIDTCASSVMQLLNCTGIAYVSESKVKTFGICPSIASIHELIIWLQMKNFTTLYTTASLSEEYEDAVQIADEASGLVAFPIIPSKGEYILCFRKEILQRIKWGGNPNEAIQFNADLKSYHPRFSFEVWKEEIENMSQSFLKYELDFARELQRIFIECRLKEQNRR